MLTVIAVLGFTSLVLVWLGMTTTNVTFHFMEMQVDPESVRSRSWWKRGWVTPTQAKAIVRLYEASGKPLRIRRANRVAGICAWIGFGGVIAWVAGMCIWMAGMRS
jgi:hypothetical protein